MQSFEDLSIKFSEHFNCNHFPDQPSSLYQPNNYFLGFGGKRVRPVLCLMANELFGEINPDAWNLATAIELFHNFTLIHDDIMDNAPLRRGKQTLHNSYGVNTAILAGDVMMVKAYDYINKIKPVYLSKILDIFNKTATEVCEGQQLDMDFEKREEVSYDDYLQMIKLKTSVLLAASLQMGGILGGGGLGNLNLLYDAGIKIGLAFQVQDDFLDAFGDSKKFGKQIGGDILANKKTFLVIRALETASKENKQELLRLFKSNDENKVSLVQKIFRDCGVDEWAKDLKNKFLDEALQYFNEMAILTKRKKPIMDLAVQLVGRDY